MERTFVDVGQTAVHVRGESTISSLEFPPMKRLLAFGALSACALALTACADIHVYPDTQAGKVAYVLEHAPEVCHALHGHLGDVRERVVKEDAASSGPRLLYLDAARQEIEEVVKREPDSAACFAAYDAAMDEFED